MALHRRARVEPALAGDRDHRARGAPRRAALVRVALLVPDRAGLVDPLDRRRLRRDQGPERGRDVPGRGARPTCSRGCCSRGGPRSSSRCSRSRSRRCRMRARSCRSRSPTSGSRSRRWLAVRALAAPGLEDGAAGGRARGRRHLRPARVRRAARPRSCSRPPSSGSSAAGGLHAGAGSLLAAGAARRSSRFSSTSLVVAQLQSWSFGQYFNHQTITRAASPPGRSRSGSGCCR